MTEYKAVLSGKLKVDPADGKTEITYAIVKPGAAALPLSVQFHPTTSELALQEALVLLADRYPEWRKELAQALVSLAPFRELD